jgi:hypothetical protein
VLFDASGDNLPLIIRSPGSDRDKTCISDAKEVTEEEDEHQLVSSRKIRATSKHLAANFSAQIRGYFFSYIKNVLTFFKHFSDLSSHRRHLIFQVFTI